MTAVTALTSRCRVFGHREFALTYEADVVVQPDVSWLLNHLETEVATGKEFIPGQTLRIGWMITQIAEVGHDSKLLTINEPDFRGLPLVWVEGVTSTLAQLRAQKSAIESCESGLEASFADVRQSALCCARAGAVGYHMERFEVEGRDSGWFIGCSECQRHDLKRLSLYELACRHPVLVDFMAFPNGSEILLERGVPLRLQYRRSRIAVRAGSYLERKYIHEGKSPSKPPHGPS